MNLKILFNRVLDSKILLRIIAVASLIGFADTVYLTANHYMGTGVQCLLFEGCEIVLTSWYSEIFGIPLVILGVMFYGGIFLVVNIYDIYQNNLFLYLLKLGGIAGFVASLVFLFIQLFILEALCFYCLISFGSSTVIFVDSRKLHPVRSIPNGFVEQS